MSPNTRWQTVTIGPAARQKTTSNPRRRRRRINKTYGTTFDRLEQRNLLATVTDSTVSGNVAADGGGGGGITINQQGLLTLIGSTVSGNRATGEGGGGIQTPDFSALFIEDSFITQHTISGDASGGGIYALGEVQITDSVISENQSSFFGGGVFAGGGSSSFSDLIIENSIVAGHVAADGIGSDLSSNSNITFDVRNSLIDNNANTPLSPQSVGGNTANFSAALTQPANLFDAQPELLDQIEDFDPDLDDAIQGLPV